MAKKSVTLDGLLNTQSRPTDTGIPQRGAEPLNAAPKPPRKKREDEKRLTLALDGETYRRLRMHAAATDQTHQNILESALTDYLKKVTT